jgi:hypothetical protein
MLKLSKTLEAIFMGKESLALVRDAAETALDPPRSLGKPGRSLWDRIMREYAIRDAGGIELLLLACEATDRAASLRDQIDRDGELIPTRSGLKEHPGLKAELANRAFVSRTLKRLGLDVEPVRPGVGRPGGGIGWVPP